MLNRDMKISVERGFNYRGLFEIAIVSQTHFLAGYEVYEWREGETLPEEGRIPVTETMLEGLSQRLWDLGIRPREALNHEETISALKGEIAFLRRLVEAAYLVGTKGRG